MQKFHIGRVDSDARYSLERDLMSDMTEDHPNYISEQYTEKPLVPTSGIEEVEEKH
tara:strand:+ start:132 stop:299 length:168 start_codon:yes stop_codon:yes gene_type:complete